jgi:hypothetical protein
MRYLLAHRSIYLLGRERRSVSEGQPRSDAKTDQLDGEETVAARVLAQSTSVTYVDEPMGRNTTTHHRHRRHRMNKSRQSNHHHGEDSARREERIAKG